jgi:heme b synthase
MAAGVKKKVSIPPLRMIAWEVTRACNLDCVHCRAAAVNEPPPGELSTEEAFSFLDEVASFSSPVIILSGGEPLMRRDIFEIAAYGRKIGLKMVMAPNGTLVNDKVATKLGEVGIDRVSISIDGSTPEKHDNFRRVPGAFEGALRGIEALKRAGISFQINTTVTRFNLSDLSNILTLTKRLGAAAWHVFLLVPTGRAKDMKSEEISPEEYERTLNWLYDVQRKEGIFVKPTCAPHYYRIARERAKTEGEKISFSQRGYEAMTRGCLGGISYCFISHIGEVYPCGYLEVKAGDGRKEGIKKVWEESSLFQNLRDFSRLKGKCGVCEFVKVCGGCRARAFALSGDYLDEEPFCTYEPYFLRKGKGKVGQ